MHMSAATESRMFAKRSFLVYQTHINCQIYPPTYGGIHVAMRAFQFIKKFGSVAKHLLENTLL